MALRQRPGGCGALESTRQWITDLPRPRYSPYATTRRLDTVETATTQRIVDGRLVTTDGPFAETKECLAGFLIVEAEDLDQALDWAARIPAARTGCVEVRPVKPYS